MSETIFRIQKNAENPFVMIDKRITKDKRLSYKAKFLSRLCGGESSVSLTISSSCFLSRLCGGE